MSGLGAGMGMLGLGGGLGGFGGLTGGVDPPSNVIMVRSRCMYVCIKCYTVG